MAAVALAAALALGGFQSFVPHESQASGRAHRPWRRHLRAHVLASEGQPDVASMRAREIKQLLVARGVDTSGVFEKADLVRLALEQPSAPSAPQPARTIPLRPVGAQEGFGGVYAGDAKVYRSIQAELTDMQRSVDLVIDTASSNSLLSPSLASSLGGSSTGATVTASSATGDSAGLTQVRLGAVSVGGIPCGTLEPVVMQLPLADASLGILGLDVLARLDLDLRFEREEAEVYEARTFASAGDTSGLAPVLCAFGPGRLLTIRVALVSARAADSAAASASGAPVVAIVDSGSPTTLANWAAASAAGIERDVDTRRGTQAVIGVTGEAVPVDEADAVVRIEPAAGQQGTIQRRVKLSIGDVPIFQALGLQGTPALVLGLDVLGTKRLVLAVADGRIWLPVQ